jgi:hypothetical protein
MRWGWPKVVPRGSEREREVEPPTFRRRFGSLGRAAYSDGVAVLRQKSAA